MFENYTLSRTVIAFPSSHNRRTRQRRYKPRGHLQRHCSRTAGSISVLIISSVTSCHDYITNHSVIHLLRCCAPDKKRIVVRRCFAYAVRFRSSCSTSDYGPPPYARHDRRTRLPRLIPGPSP